MNDQENMDQTVAKAYKRDVERAVEAAERYGKEIPELTDHSPVNAVCTLANLVLGHRRGVYPSPSEIKSHALHEAATWFENLDPTLDDIGHMDPVVEKTMVFVIDRLNAMANATQHLDTMVRWDLLPGHLIDNHEGDTVSEELLQSALSDMIKRTHAYHEEEKIHTAFPIGGVVPFPVYQYIGKGSSQYALLGHGKPAGSMKGKFEEMAVYVDLANNNIWLRDPEDFAYRMSERGGYSLKRSYNVTLPVYTVAGSDIVLHHNFITHRETWRDALLIASQRPELDESDRSFWKHELKAFDDSYDPATGLPKTEDEIAHEPLDPVETVPVQDGLMVVEEVKAPAVWLTSSWFSPEIENKSQGDAGYAWTVAYIENGHTTQLATVHNGLKSSERLEFTKHLVRLHNSVEHPVGDVSGPWTYSGHQSLSFKGRKIFTVYGSNRNREEMNLIRRHVCNLLNAHEARLNGNLKDLLRPSQFRMPNVLYFDDCHVGLSYLPALTWDGEISGNGEKAKAVIYMVYDDKEDFPFRVGALYDPTEVPNPPPLTARDGYKKLSDAAQHFVQLIGYSENVTDTVEFYEFQKRFEKKPYQERVKDWTGECFGNARIYSTNDRKSRFLEEALETFQAFDGSKEDAYLLVDYVFGRPKGIRIKEIGGLMLVTAALCNSAGIDMVRAGEEELTNVWRNIEKIRAKQAAKVPGQPLPGYAAVKGVVALREKALVEMVRKFKAVFNEGDPMRPDYDENLMQALQKVLTVAEVERSIVFQTAAPTENGLYVWKEKDTGYASVLIVRGGVAKNLRQDPLFDNRETSRMDGLWMKLPV
jgi:hypothetical protein